MGFEWGLDGLTWVEYKGSLQTHREVWTERFLPQSASHSPPAIRLIIGDCRAALEFGLPFHNLIEDVADRAMRQRLWAGARIP